MFGRDVLILQVRCLLQGCLKHLFEMGRDVHLPLGALDLWAPLELFAEFRSKELKVRTELLEQRGNYAIVLFHQREQQVLHVDGLVPHLDGVPAGGIDRLLGLDRELIKPHLASPSKQRKIRQN